jgi:hypothetical protein
VAEISKKKLVFVENSYLKPTFCFISESISICFYDIYIMTTHSKHLISKTRNILGNLGVRFPQNKKYKNKKPQIDSKKKYNKNH